MRTHERKSRNHVLPTRRCRGRNLRPGCEPLEGRVVMASSPLDPTFGLSGAVLGALDTGFGTDLSDATAVAVQADGKIVVAGTRGQSINGSPLPSLTVRRFNADGSLDTTFGAGGQVVIAGPGGFYGVSDTPKKRGDPARRQDRPGGGLLHPAHPGRPRRGRRECGGPADDQRPARPQLRHGRRVRDPAVSLRPIIRGGAGRRQDRRGGRQFGGG